MCNKPIASGIFPTIGKLAGATLLCLFSAARGWAAPEIPHAALIGETGPESGAHISAGAPLSKSWTLENTGQTVWQTTDDYAFVFGGGDQLASAGTVSLDAEEYIEPGHTRTFTVDFDAPTERGEYAGFWSLRSDDTHIGERVWMYVRIHTPDVRIVDRPPLMVSDHTATVHLGGLADGTAIGLLRWSNTLTGATGGGTTDETWSLDDVPVGTGENEIVVTATNAYGVARSDSITVTRTAPGADTDGDGLPDWWEELHFGGITNAVPEQSGDGSGVSNYAQYIADTDPTDPHSVLRIVNITFDPDIEVHFNPASTARVYSLFYTDDLIDGMWDNVTGDTPVPGSGGTDQHPAPESHTSGYYRIKVELP